MPSYVAFFRAVNLGGTTQLRMTALRDVLAGAGYAEVRTLLQSGNVVFRSNETDSGAVEQAVEGRIADALHVRTEVFVRTDREWRSVVTGNPFRAEAVHDPAHLMVLVLKDAPSPDAWRSLSEGISGREVARGAGRHGYLVYPDGVGRSRLTLDRIERTLGTRGTLRNWNTAGKIDVLLSA